MHRYIPSIMSSHTAKKPIPHKKCFYCNKEAHNITVDDEGELFYLCEKHIKLFRALNPREGYKQKDDEDD